MSLVEIASPFHGLHVRGKLDDLRAERRIQNPAGAHGNFRSAALASRQIDFDTHVTGFDARDAHRESEYENHHQQNGRANRQTPNAGNSRAHREFLVAAAPALEY